MRRTVVEVREITQTLQDMSIGFNRKRHNSTKVKCPNCKSCVRRDGLKTHRTSSKCARKARKYNKKKHDGQMKACPLCKVKVVWGKMKRHQASARCFNAVCGGASENPAISRVPTSRRGSTVFRFSDRLFCVAHNAFLPYVSYDKPSLFTTRKVCYFPTLILKRNGRTVKK